MSHVVHNSRLLMRSVHKRFGATLALRDVNLDAIAGEVLGLVGENGAGKSTLMKILSGAIRPDAGQIWLDGSPFVPVSPMHARRAGVAMIYQELSLAPHLSVEENIVLGIEPVLGPLVRRREMRRLAQHAMEQAGLSGLSPAVPVRELSLAQQQLVEIARALATQCRVLALDEPTSSLGASDIRRLFDLIRRLKQQGIAIIYISHFLEEISAIGDRYLVLRDGMSVANGVIADATHDQLVALMVGRDVSELYPRSPRTPGELALRVEGLSGRARPRDAALELRRGEVMGIAGLMGAGRTELLRAIFGLDAVSTGAIRLGTFQGASSPASRWRQGAGFVSENRKAEGLALRLSIADNLTLPRLQSLGIGRLVMPWRQASASRPWIEQLSIRCRSPQQAVAMLSGGNQQKVALARLLHADVDVLLLDEPTRGIDVGSKAQIYRLIDQLARNGCAILIVSSYLPELLGVCDRIAVMCRGRLGAARPTAEWTEHTLMAAAIGTSNEPAAL